jgi:protein-tyrosine phosphatase
MTSPKAQNPTPGTRHLPLEGAYNIRDLGGYETSDGRTTRWGQYLRSDTLANLPPASVDALVDYGIRNIVDLRRSAEVQFKSSPFVGSEAVIYYHQNMAGDIGLVGREKLLEIPDQAERRAGTYCMILDQRKLIVWEIMSILAQPDGLPALVHCNAGKDRAGIIAAFVLSISGVPRKTIVEDYVLTARYNVVRYVQDTPGLSSDNYSWEEYQAMACAPETMEITLDYLDTNYGGVEGYLGNIGITDEQLSTIRDSMVQ